LLFGVCAVLFLLSGTTFFGYDGEIMYRVSESLVLRHSIQIIDPIYHINQPYGGYAIGLSLLMAPLVAMGALLLHDPRALVTLLEPMLTAGAVVTLNLLLVKLGCSRRRSLVIALVYAFGTLAWHYTGVLFTEPATGLCLTLTLFGLLAYRRQARVRWLVLAGGAVGVAVTLRWDAVLTVAVPTGLFALWMVARSVGRWRPRALSVALFGAPIMAGIAINLAYDLVRFAKPLGGAYAADPLGFPTPLLTGIYGLLFSPGVGLFVYTPVLLMSVLAFPAFLRRWRMEALLILALFAVRVLFYARWWAWDGGGTWGPRFLVPLLPLLLVPLAFLPRKRRFAIATGALALVGIGIQVLDQLVPYGLYYATVVTQLTTQLGICHGCVPFPGSQTEAVSRITDFDWRYAPIVVQLKYLLQGIMAPAWAPLALLVPPVLLGGGAVLARLYALVGDAENRTATSHQILHSEPTD